MHVKSFFLLVSFSLAMNQTIQAQEPFLDVTQSVGFNGLSGSVAAWGDYNNDGWTDLYVGGQLWKNEQGKRFTRVENTPLSGPGIWGDYNNDGFLDLYSWTGQLFRNEKGKGFTKLDKAIPSLPTTVSMGATWVDLDNDGLLDLYIGGYERWQVANYHDVILHNQGDGTFREIWRSTGSPKPTRGITAADFDEDGDMDIYLSHYRLVANILFQNNGKGKLKDVATPWGVAGHGELGAWGHTIGSAWGDFDNDGYIDLFVGNFSHPPAYQDRPYFYKNLGPKQQYKFQDQSKIAKLHWQESYASPALADYDNDGDIDLYFTTVYPRDHSVFYQNDGGWRFSNITQKTKLNPKRTYQAAWADFDNDGDLDLLSGGRLYQNPGTKNHWLKIRLQGMIHMQADDDEVVRSDKVAWVNAAAIGARVKITIGQRIYLRQVEGATGQGNQNDLTLHFGLGAHLKPVTINIIWPNGKTQQVTSKVNQLLNITYDPEK